MPDPRIAPPVGRLKSPEDRRLFNLRIHMRGWARAIARSTSGQVAVEDAPAPDLPSAFQVRVTWPDGEYVQAFGAEVAGGYRAPCKLARAIIAEVLTRRGVA